MNIAIRQAEVRDTERVSSVLIEAADWLRERGIPMWRADELAPDRITSDVVRGDFFVAEFGDEIAGTVKFQLQDALFWPDTPADEAAFIHRLAVRRSYAGGRISGVLLRWAADRARSYHRRYLRLDCEAARPRLRAVYERFGFRYHSDRQVGPYLVARYEHELQ
jgi:GNAT superfamily N-acetyltransferase